MKQPVSLASSLLCAVLSCSTTGAAEVKPAVERGLAMITQAATRWPQNKTCFSCHHQTLPMLAATEANRAGLPLDGAWMRTQGDIALHYFEERVEDMDDGEHVPGGAATTAFGFWALSLDRRTNNATTASMVKYLLQIQGVRRTSDRKPDQPLHIDDGRWLASCRRPPMQASLVGDTVLVLMGLEEFADAGQKPAVAKARAAAETWLSQAPLRSQQDRLWRLWGLHHLGGSDSAKQNVLAALLAAQNADGGWGEDAGRSNSDAYTTGQALYMLLKTGTPHDAPPILLARDWLLRAQLSDGSWKAETHTTVKGQIYFDNGDPHGESQFLSTAATAWATAGLAILLQP